MPRKMQRAKPLGDNNTTRPPKLSAAKRGYDKRHQALRLERLAMHPICEICQAAFSHHAHHLIYPATCVEHYQALCERCHMKLEHEKRSTNMGSQN